ncbi:MAG: pilus assembly protein PilP [Burkholderiaceae bacterium]|nr:MAG: pilus assembly protein PilP [Burkholderiaceae bacterium]
MRIATTFSLALIATLLAGCFGNDQAEIREWMEQTRKETPVRVEKINPPKEYTPFQYASQGSADPFDPVKLADLLKRLADKNSKGKRPDFDRRREVLEAYALDSMKMVGVMEKNKQIYALISADQTLHQVHVGNYLGQNFGKIVKITETEVTLKELAQDAAGDWVERDATLQLQEGGK